MSVDPKRYRIANRDPVINLLLQKRVREWAADDDFGDIILNGHRGLNDLDEAELIEELFYDGLLIAAMEWRWVVRTVQDG